MMEKTSASFDEFQEEVKAELAERKRKENAD